MMVISSMTDEEVEKFEKLPAEERERQIRFAMLAQLRPLSEWMSDERTFELRRELDSAS
jgi:hypothetical protein